MKLSMNWLKNYVDINIPIKDYCDRMTYTGSKVEGWEELGGDISNVVVGRLLSVDKHPDADKLVVCSVDVGEYEPIQIVTGAKNVKAGDIVPVAKHGSHLPNGVVIKKGKLRGVESNGMLCSMSELNLDGHDMPDGAPDGILILQEGTPGQDIHDALMLSDTVVEFEITPNRPDCLSVIGLARETAASFGKTYAVKSPVVSAAEGSVSDWLKVEVTAPVLCPRYTARVVKDVKIAPSPMWLRRYLRASGVRPINNIVDITNYVMLEYGQPMHAFDYACVSGGRINVRTPSPDEKITTLDGQTRTLAPDMLVIADADKPIALAGIMGGENSEIKDTTSVVVFESANFNPGSVRSSSRRLGLRTESSSRYEKGLYPHMTLDAVQRACELVVELCAGTVVDGIIDVSAPLPEKRVLPLEAERINALLGTDISSADMAKMLASLDFEVSADLSVTVPHFREDVECTADLAEEVARIYGYQVIKSGTMAGALKEGKRSLRQSFDRDLHACLCALGLDEIYTYSFIGAKDYDKAGIPADSTLRQSVRLINPLGEDTALMRTTALPSMLDALARNYSHRTPAAYLYEEAKIYLPTSGDLADERVNIVIGFYDTALDRKSGEGFYILKGMVESVLDRAGITDTAFAATSHPSYHSGRCAGVTAGGQELGVLGEIHPTVSEDAYGADAKVGMYVAVLDAEVLFTLRKQESVYKPLPKYPATTRDLALVCAEQVTCGTLEGIIRKSAGKALESVHAFDLYRSAAIGEGMKSIAFALSLRDDERTLTDTEVDAIMSRVLKALEEQAGARLR
ncbi:MAG: phenylalanine--tRNA ligase subunit beta [Eubacteriales bacterium]